MRGFARVAAAVPEVVVGDVERNVDGIVALWQRAHDEGCALVVFPELCLTGYTARDLFHDRHLQASVHQGLRRLVDASRALRPMALVGAPLRAGDALYNTAVSIAAGKPLGVVPKTYLPNYREFEERRWFRSAADLAAGAELEIAGDAVPFGTDVLFAASGLPELVVGVELCEDYWVHVPPSAYAVSAGATVICNLSASNFTVGKSELRRLLARSASDRGKCAYIYTAAGPGESSTDLAFDADAFICENGRELVASRRFSREPQLVSVDIDVDMLVRERVVTGSFGECSRAHARSHRSIAFAAPDAITSPLRRKIDRHPFVPSDPQTLGARCWEIFEIQTNALATRMKALGRPKLVLGLSGGLDSTHAALVATGALELVGQPRTDLVAVTLPGFGTTAGTRGNAERLAEVLGVTFREVAIAELSKDVLAGVEHEAAASGVDLAGLLARVREDPKLGDVTFENVQARLRTLVLMTVANQVRGLVVGTGDLSEKALGWSTYAGDHISMYDVNAGVPKTLIQFVIRWVANERARTWSADTDALREVLGAILETPISPELLPTDGAGALVQRTESTLGPYEVHDFFLYHFVRSGEPPARILDLARIAFAGDHSVAQLKAWLTTFVSRFFAHQFKRSCTADGPKVGQVALSPRGDWRMPSDAVARTWLAEIDAYADGDAST